MRRNLLSGLILLAALPSIAMAQEEVGVSAQYDVTSTTKIGGAGNWGSLYADADGRRLYVPRTGQSARITVLDMDSMKVVGELAGVNAQAVAIDSKTHRGFSASSPVAMWDTNTLKQVKTITVQGTPTSILADAFNDRVYVFSKSTGNATVLNATDGAVIGTIALGGMPEQATSDGQGRVFVAITDKDEIAVIDSASMKVSARWDLDGIGAHPTTLAYVSNEKVLLVGCRNESMIYMNAETGKFIYGLPIGAGVNSVAYNAETKELFSAQDDGTFTIARISSPTSFAMGGTVVTPIGARELALDSKTGKIFVATAEFSSEPKPVSFYDIPDRGSAANDSFSILTFSK